MATIDNAMVVGVFRDEERAQQAQSSLHDAGFEQVQLLRRNRAAPQSGGLFSGIKRLFTGDNATDETEDIVHNLASTGLSQTDIRHYQQEYAAGHSILLLQTDGRKQQAIDILQRYGGYDYHASNSAAQTGAAPTASTTPTSDTSSANVTAAPDALPGATEEDDEENKELLTPSTEDMAETYDQKRFNLREERLDVNKQSVETGQVELHKDVVEEQKTIDVPVTHEEVVVERHEVANPERDTAPIGQNEEIRVPVMEEQVQVEKNPVVTGEATIGKRSVEETQQVTETTKREKLRVEPEGDAPIHGTRTDRFHKKQGQGSTGKARAKSRRRH